MTSKDEDGSSENESVLNSESTYCSADTPLLTDD